MDPINPEIQALRNEINNARKRRNMWRGAKLLIVAILTITAGFLHIVTGDTVGIYPCAKESWGLHNTFVNADEIVGVPMIGVLQKKRVVRALVECGLVQLPDGWRD